jgi:surfactin synthase thioesterase subunit
MESNYSPQASSRRRGKVSSDPDLVERRNWYTTVEASNRQKFIDAEYDGKRGSAEDLASVSEGKEEEDDDVFDDHHYHARHHTKDSKLSSPLKLQHASPSQGSTQSGLESSPKKAVSTASFSSLALDLYEEFSVKSTKSYIDEKPAPPSQYVRDSKFLASKWLHLLSTFREESRKANKVLIIFPGIGECHTKYSHWPHLLSLLGLGEDDIEVWSVCLPGRALRTTEPYVELPSGGYYPNRTHTSNKTKVADSSGRPCVVNVASMVLEALIECNVIHKFSKRVRRPVRHLYMFGHSVGSLIAFEVARLLARPAVVGRINIKLEHLMVSAQKGPAHLSQINVDQFRLRLSTRPFKELYEYLNQMHLLPMELRERKELLTMFISLLRADLSLAEEYFLYPDRALHNIPASVCDSNSGEFVEDEQSVRDTETIISGYSSNTSTSFTQKTCNDDRNDDDPHRLDCLHPVLHVPITTIGAMDDPYAGGEEALMNWNEVTSASHYYFVFPVGFNGHNFLSTFGNGRNSAQLYDEFTGPSATLDEIRESTYVEEEDDGLDKRSETNIEKKQKLSPERKKIRVFDTSKSALFNVLIVVACICSGRCKLRHLMNAFIDEISD